jgi:hypothetical protein
MTRFLFFILCLSALSLEVNAQTCCSGGIPIGGNVSLKNNPAGAWQLGLTGDLNILKNLKDGSQKLNDETRERNIYTLMLRGGYNITDDLAVGALFPFVRQERWIVTQAANDYSYTQGLGDLIIVSQYRLPFSTRQNTYQVGLGSKLSTGPADLESREGITYNMDMQPGTGSTDWLFFGSFNRRLNNIPGTTLTAKFFYRLTGRNTDYLDETTYQLGNEWQLVGGLSDQFLWGSHIFNASLLVKARHMKKNQINGSVISNTGGTWYHLMPSVTYMPNQQINISVVPEIPVYSDLNGTQLTTSYRVSASLIVTFGSPSAGSVTME